MKTYLNKLQDWIYRKFLSKQYLTWSERARKQGYEQGLADGKEAFDNYKHRITELNGAWFIDPLEVLTVSERGMLLFDGDQLTDVEVKELKSEAKFLKNTRIYRIFQETIKQKAVEKSVNLSKNWEEVLAGKMMVHNLGIIKSIVDVMDKYQSR